MMEGLCERLQDEGEAGVYRLNCPLGELREAAGKAGFEVFEADLAAVHGKGEFLAALAGAIAAPEWFGHNLDALADALGDLSWRPAQGYALLLHGGGLPGLEESDRAAVSEIFADAANFWRLHGVPFWVFYC